MTSVSPEGRMVSISPEEREDATSQRTADIGSIARDLFPAATSLVVGAPVVGGMTNLAYEVEVDGLRHVLRVVDPDADGMLAIDRAREVRAMSMAADAGIAPAVAAASVLAGHLATPFIEGRTWLWEEYADRLPAVAALLRRVHVLPPVEGVFDPYRDIEQRLALVRARGDASVPADLTRLDRRLAAARERREEALGGQLVVCHNDPWHSNLRDDLHGKTWLLDWEFAGMGDPGFDIATVYCCAASGGGSWNPPDLTSFAQVWGLEPDASFRSMLEDMTFVIFYWNATWALSKASLPRLAVHDYDLMAKGLFHMARLRVE